MMDSTFWVAVAAWGLVVAVTVGAVLFGQVARESLQRYPAGHVPSNVRLGVAVSITGPILVVLIGLLVAGTSGAWLGAALGTFAVVVAVAATGWFLAPR